MEKEKIMEELSEVLVGQLMPYVTVRGRLGAKRGDALFCMNMGALIHAYANGDFDYAYGLVEQIKKDIDFVERHTNGIKKEKKQERKKDE